MTVHFIPAIGEQINNAWERGLEYKGKTYKFFEDTSFFKYPIALQTAFYGFNRGMDFRKRMGIGKDVKLMGDCGGFEVASMKLRGEECKLKPIDSLRWQEQNCDIVMALDIPPSITGENTHKEFVEALAETVENFKLFEDKRENKEAWFYNVLHGDNMEQLEEWYDKVKDFKFDGWASGMKPPHDPMLQALAVMFLWHKGEFDKPGAKGLHFFGISGKTVVPTLVYIGNEFQKRCNKDLYISYDSSSYNVGSIYRRYFLNLMSDFHLFFGDKFEKENPNIDRLPCTCPVCSEVGDIQELNGKTTNAGVLISLHNMFKYIEYSKILNGLVHNKEKYLEYLKSINAPQKTFRSIEFVDCCFEKGFEHALGKYEMYINFQPENKALQKGIFGF